MLEIGLPILFAVLVWWFSTGAILFLDGLPRRTFATSLAVTSLVAVGALVVLWRDSGSTDVVSAYTAFTAAVLIWGWNEMAFLMGFITGSRRQPSSGTAVGWTRFREAMETVIHHELAIALSAIAIAFATWGSPNMTGLWTFLVLWVMRLSTKFNIFLGAPNVTDEFLPANLNYLSSYFRRRPMNGFFPLAVTLATLVTAYLVHKAVWAQGNSFETVRDSLLASLMALAVLEHWLLYIPLPTSWLWGWSLKGDRLATSSPSIAAGIKDLPSTPLPGGRS